MITGIHQDLTVGPHVMRSRWALGRPWLVVIGDDRIPVVLAAASSVTVVARSFNVSRQTVYRALEKETT